MNYSISELISYFGGSLGIILSLILLLKAKGVTSVRISLAMYLLIGSIMIILGSVIYSGKIVSFPHLIRVDSLVHYTFLPFGFFFVYAVFKPDFKFRWIHLLNFIPLLLNLVKFFPFYLKDAAYKIDYYNNYVGTAGSFILPLQYLIKTLLGLFYLALQLYVFQKYRPRNTGKSADISSQVLWFRIFFAGEAIMIGGLLFDHATGLHYFKDPYRFSITMVTFFIYDITLALLFFPQILYGSHHTPNTHVPREKYNWSKLNTDDKAMILEKVDNFLKDAKKPYLNPKISLQEVSVVLDINPGKLSQVINERTGLNFKDYINTLRIEEAKLILSSPDYQKLTIEAIAEKAGFNSKSPFYSAFKKHTGMTPKEFVELNAKGG